MRSRETNVGVTQIDLVGDVDKNSHFMASDLESEESTALETLDLTIQQMDVQVNESMSLNSIIDESDNDSDSQGRIRSPSPSRTRPISINLVNSARRIQDSNKE